MRKAVYLILSIVFTAMLLVNYGQDTGKDTKTEILNLKFNDWVPDGLPAIMLWKDVVAKIADNTNYVLGSAPGIHELTEIFHLPFLGFKDYDQAFRIYNEIINEFSEIQEENKKKV